MYAVWLAINLLSVKALTKMYAVWLAINLLSVKALTLVWLLHAGDGYDIQTS